MAGWYPDLVSVGGLGDGADLGGEGQGGGVAVGLAEDDIDLVDGVGSVLELGDVEALLLLDVLADDLGELDGLGHADLDGLGGSDLNGDTEGSGDKGDGVLLGLVLLSAVLVLAGVAVGVSVAGWVARSDPHGLRLELRGDLNRRHIRNLSSSMLEAVHSKIEDEQLNE